MQNKLQELTDKLFNEGLSKGKEESERLISNARKEAEEIISRAREQAIQITTDAEKQAAEMKAKVTADLKMASAHTVSALKQTIENAVTAKAFKTPVKESFSDSEFIKKLILTIAQAFKADSVQAVDLDVILPSSLKDEISEAAVAQISSSLDTGLEVKYVKGLSNGFRIGPKDGGYVLDFTADEFSNLIAEYLRPTARKVLFSE